MKKIFAIITITFILFITALPSLAVECGEHVVNYPATPAYTHEVGIDIYHCANCSHEMWCCEECDQYMAIEEISCDNCGQYRAAINSQEQAEINQMEKNNKEARGFTIGFIIFMAIVIVIIGVSYRTTCW